MKIVLVYPMWRNAFPVQDYLAGGLIQLGLRYLISNLPENVEWELLDCRRLTRQSYESKLRKAAPDAVGIYCATHLLEAAREAARIARSAVPKAKRLVGGIHVSVAPEDFADDMLWDLGLVGQAEVTLAQYCTEPERYEHRRLLVAAEDRQGAIAWPDLYNHPYRFPGESEPTLFPNLPQPGHSIIIARGCPYKCKFCAPAEAIHFSQRVRSRTVPNVLVEIEQLRASEAGLGTLLIHDDCFTFQPKLVREFCEAVKDMGLSWTCQASVRDIIMDPALPRVMADAGCVWVVVGFESGSDRILSLMDKSATREEGIRVAALFHEAGVKVWANYILGLPTESRGDMEDTERFLSDASVDYRSGSVFTPHPGSFWGEQFKGDLIGTTIQSGERYTTGPKLTWQDAALLKEFTNRCQKP